MVAGQDVRQYNRIAGDQKIRYACSEVIHLTELLGDS